MKIIYESIDKISKTPLLCSFYILNGGIYYSTLDNGIEHPSLWRAIINKAGLFDKLVLENRVDLVNSPYGTDRGRVTWTGKMIEDTPDLHSTGKYILMGTAGCKEYEEKLKSLFGLKGMSKEKLEVDWTPYQGHYQIRKTDMNTLKDMIKLVRGITPHNTHIARLVESKKESIIKKVLAKLASK